MINRSAVYNKRIRQKFFKKLTLSYAIILFSIKYSDIKGHYLPFRKMIMMCVYIQVICQRSVSFVSQLVSFYLKNCIEKHELVF